MLNIMDNSYKTDNNLVKSITGTLQDSTSVSPIVDSSSYSSSIFSNSANGNSTSTGFFSFFSNISWYVWVIIILILAFLGINIFTYLDQGTQDAKTMLSPFVDFFGKLFSGTVLETTKQTINASNEGVNSVANASMNTISNTQNKLSNNGNGNEYENSNSTEIQGENVIHGELAKTKQTNQMVINPTGAAMEEDQEDSLQKALDEASHSTSIEADDSFSSIQKTAGKPGWCYIGEEKGIRSCLQVGVNDMCLSGNIFPTQDVCINPSLRA